MCARACARRVVSGHFPVCERDGAVEAFADAFRWAKTKEEPPEEYVDLEDLDSLNVVVGILRAIKAVPPK